MRLLLDENLPNRLKSDFPNHEVFTVTEKLWNGKQNGELLRLMLADRYSTYKRLDKFFKNQQY